jgi:hypothetical protein
VVGVDGSDSSKAALRWAIRQAKLTGSTVDAVTAWHYPSMYGWAPVADGVVDIEGEAKKSLTEALADLSALFPLGLGLARQGRFMLSGSWMSLSSTRGTSTPRSAVVASRILRMSRLIVSVSARV